MGDFFYGTMLRELWAVIRMELILEFERKYAFNGLLLYVLSMVLVISLSFLQQINPLSWNIMYWIIMLFAAMNTVAKSFMGGIPGQHLYLYTLSRPESIIIGRIIYNTVLLFLMGLITWIFFSTLGDVQVQEVSKFILLIFAGSFAFSANLSLVGAIAAQALNRSTLLAVLSFPIIVPIVLNLISASRSAIEGFEATGGNRVGLILGIALGLSMASWVLFPLIWRE